MALTNAEKQARFRQRQKAKLEAAPITIDALRAENKQLRVEIARLKGLLTPAKVKPKKTVTIDHDPLQAMFEKLVEGENKKLADKAARIESEKRSQIDRAEREAAQVEKAFSNAVRNLNKGNKEDPQEDSSVVRKQAEHQAAEAERIERERIQAEAEADRHAAPQRYADHPNFGRFG